MPNLLSASQGRVVAAGYFLAFASGATALVYEVLWTRQFISLFGATTPAISATLSAIFLGFAVGNAVVGSRSARWRRPLRIYGMLEIGIGLTVLLVAPLLGLYEHLYPVVYARFSAYPVAFVLVKTCLAAAALFMPAFLMGGTLPLLAQAFVSAPRKLGEIGGGVYAANTFGATLGALSVPFYLLPSFGANRSYLAAATANFLIGALAIRLDRSARGATAGVEPEPELRPQPAKGTVRASPARTPVALAFLSGALVLALEVLWTRMLAQVHENSIYSFAVVLAVFLAGLAVGAVIARVFIRRGWNPEKLLGLAWVGAGVCVFGSPPLFYFLTDGLRFVNEFGSRSNLVTLGFAVSVMFLPTCLAGMILPLLLEMIANTRKGAAGALLGRLLAFNTAGAIIGPLVATYAVLPALGLWVGIAAAGVLMIAAGESALRGLFETKFVAARRTATALLLLALVLGGNPFTLPRAQVKRDGNERLIHLAEGSHGIVAVLETHDDRWMLLNNFYTLGGTASAVEERQQARIPLLLHPAPRQVAFLGLGTGITAGGALLPTVDNLVALELVPEVVTTAKDYFAEANLGLLTDRKAEVINEDARIYLKAGGKKFDVIVGDLVVPWRSGESSLFTREHFETARHALAPGGIYCQWLPLYQLSEEQLRIIVATFLDVFPQATLWRGDFFPDAPALALIGHTAPNGIDARLVDQTAQQLKPWSAPGTPLLAAPGGLWLFLVGALDPADPQFATARRNRESEPWIELLSPSARPGAPRAASSRFVGEGLYRFMERVRAHPVNNSPLARLSPEQLTWRDSGAILWEASMLLSAGREEEANRRAAQALSSLPNELQAVIRGETSPK
ncbi:MAG TPA: fused MFS/spermidine synthase [Pyrinomonadaceae bacterium]|jgi:spermidine synthase